LVDDVAAIAQPDLAGGLRTRIDRQRAWRDRHGDAARQRLQLLPLVAEAGAAGVRILAKLATVRVAVAALRALDHGSPLRVFRRASTEGIARPQRYASGILVARGRGLAFWTSSVA